MSPTVLQEVTGGTMPRLRKYSTWGTKIWYLPRYKINRTSWHLLKVLKKAHKEMEGDKGDQ